nr:MAG: hypothetical protein DIU61_18155 [Bacteroidota bacterium]
MDPVIVTPPASEPVTLSEAKAQLSVTSSAHDTRITSLITTARRQVERYLKRALITQTWKVYYNCFHAVMELPYPPLQSVTHVKYYDDSGTLQTLSSDLYWEDLASEPGKIVRKYDAVYPELLAGRPNAVEIQYVAGYGDADDVPEEIRHAILMLVTDYFDNRGEVVVGSMAQRIPGFIKDLVHDYRMYDFAH